MKVNGFTQMNDWNMDWKISFDSNIDFLYGQDSDIQ